MNTSTSREAMEMSVYLPLTGLSMVASCITIFTAFDTKDIRRSAVQYCTFSVFCCDLLWAFFRFVLYVLGMIDGSLPTSNKGDRHVPDLDRAIVGCQAVTTALGDLFIVASAIWIVLSAYEMQRVVTHSMTRPKEKERKVILFYDILVYVPLTILILAFAIGPVAKQDVESTSDCLRVSLYIVVWSLFIAVLYLPYAMYRIYSIRRDRPGFFDHSLEHIYHRVRILLFVYSATTIPTSIVSLGSEVAALTNNSTNFLGENTSDIFFGANCLFYLTGLFNAISIGGSVLCCIRCLRPVMPKELHEELMSGGIMRQSEALLTSQTSHSPPVHMPVFVCTDIESSTLLWSQQPGAMTEAQSMHDDCMRQHLSTYNGYEITTAGDAFQLAFHTVTEAISYCVTVQLRLLDLPWPKVLDEYRSAKTVTDLFGRTLFRGLRVRMAIHLGGGDMIYQTHPTTGKMTYSGLHELVAREIGDSGLGGQILISMVTKHRYLDEVQEWPKPSKKDKRIKAHFKDFFFREAPSCHIVDLNIVEPMSEVVPYLLRARHGSMTKRKKPMDREMPGINLHLSMRRSSTSQQSASERSHGVMANHHAFKDFDLHHAPVLTKRGKTIHHVVLRVFVIADGYVFYFKNASATQPSGLLPIEGSEFKLHKYQIGRNTFNICFEIQSPLRSWGSVVLHYHNCTDANGNDVVQQLESAGSKRIYGNFEELSTCPGTDTVREEYEISTVKEACPSTESRDSHATTVDTSTSIDLDNVLQITHFDKRGHGTPVLDLTWAELHEDFSDLTKALGVSKDEHNEKTLDITNELCHDLCSHGHITRPWGGLSMEASILTPRVQNRRQSSSLSSCTSFASDHEMGSGTMHLDIATVVPLDGNHASSSSPEQVSPTSPTDRTLRASRRTSLHKKTHSRDSSMVISSGIVVPQKAVPDVKLIQAISLAESYSGGFSLRQYTPLKMVGKGGFGQVMVARHNTTHQVVAIKTMNKHTLTTQNQVAHTKAERNVLIKCYNHPFIVKLLASFQTIDHLHMVLEFCPGGELFFHLTKAGRFSEAHAAFYCAEVYLALDHLHRHSIIYRDLKPENVLLDRDGHVRLADFGLSKENVNERKLAATFCGSAEYISPEVLELADAAYDEVVPLVGGYDKGVDLWALGCLIFELLTGLPPFYSGKCRSELYAKIKEGHVEFPSYISTEAKDVIKSLLQPDPKQRLGYKDVNALKEHPFFKKHIEDWDKLMAKQVVPPMQPPSGEYMNFDDSFTSMPLGKEALEEMAEFTKRNTTEHQLFDNYNWAPPESTIPNAS